MPAAVAEGAPAGSDVPPAGLSSPAFVVLGPVLEDARAVFGPLRPAEVRTGLGSAPAARPVRRKARPAPRVVEAAVAERVERAAARPASRSATRRAATRPVVRRVVARKAPAVRGMSAVVSFARSKVGARYGTSPGRYDCSKLTQAAYRAAGIKLPRQSGAQAARAYRISWAQARPGDLIVGRGHVGIYMGRRGGRYMMIDAGNSRVGVSYRAVYFNSQGLHPERVR